MKRVELVSIGRIIRSEGKDGTLKIKLYHQSLRELSFRKIYLEKEGECQEYQVENFSLGRNSPFLKLKEVNNLQQAEALRGREILVKEEDFPALEEGSYYDFQLLGCLVETKTGRRLGEVIGLITIGDTTLLEVKVSGREVEIPLVEAVCQKIDVANKKIIIDPPEGLLELNEV
ncbi:MAG: ribosome maturation factor RimM [Candidatus Saccharicenans sp.]